MGRRAAQLARAGVVGQVGGVGGRVAHTGCAGRRRQLDAPVAGPRGERSWRAARKIEAQQ